MLYFAEEALSELNCFAAAKEYFCDLQNLILTSTLYVDFSGAGSGTINRVFCVLNCHWLIPKFRIEEMVK